MSTAPNPDEVYRRAVEEGERRLSMHPVELAATGFIAGVTIVFGIVALAIVEALVEPDVGEGVASVAGALAFGIGVVFVVIGRTELFSENFFGPVAAAIEADRSRPWVQLLRLWGGILVLNLIGGAVLVALLTVEGALPSNSTHALVTIADEVAGKSPAATLVRAVLAGALITLLSYMVSAVDTASARILVSFLVGFFLALGPFDHVVVSALHLLFGIWLDGAVSYADLGINIALSTAGNLAGGLLLITLTHTAQVLSRRA